MASALQIIAINSDNKIVANETLLKKIFLDPSIKDKKVCVISIAGTFRQGKSFLLNFFIRYLELKYKLKKVINEKWLDPEDGNISGFPWKYGSDRHTTGIMMWSEIFLAELSSGEEVAVILLDTQGTFDNKTTKQQCAAIFAIATLISSVLIFNLKEKINQYDLEHLECFSGFGQLAFEQNGENFGPPFQNICFLIRDWQYCHEFDFGLKGGQELLQKDIHSPENVPRELRQQKENILALFENISCCLLPYPGEKVATDPSFHGSFNDINPKFLENVEDFIPVLLGPEKLQPKHVNGEKITCNNLLEFLQIYTKYFSSGNVPPLKTMYMASAEAQLKIISQEAENLYRKAMDVILDTEESLKTEILEEHHLEEKQKVIEYFNDKKIMGNNELKLKFKEFLKEKLDQRYVEYRKLNRIKQETEEKLAEQEEYFQQEQDAAKSEAQNELQKKLDELKDIQMSLERQLWEKDSKHKDEMFGQEIEKLKQQQQHRDELQKKDEEISAEKQKRLEDNLAAKQELFEEEQKRHKVEMEAEFDAKLHAQEVRFMTEDKLRLQKEKNELTGDKKELTETVTMLTGRAEHLKQQLKEEQEKSHCVIS